MHFAQQLQPPAANLEDELFIENAHEKQRDKRCLNNDAEGYEKLRYKIHAQKNAGMGDAAHGTYYKYGDRVHHEVQKQRNGGHCRRSSVLEHENKRCRLAAGRRRRDRGKENIGGGKNNALSGGKTMPEESAGALQAKPLKVDKAKCAQHGKHYPHRISTL